MLERDARRRYFWELGSAMVFYAAVLAISLRLVDAMEPGSLRTALALAPAIPVFVLIWVIARQYRRSDEFVRLRHLESMAVAFGVTAGITFTYGFLESAGFPRQSAFWVWGIMGFTWAIHSSVRLKRAGC